MNKWVRPAFERLNGLLRPWGTPFGGFMMTADEFCRAPPEWRPGPERILVLAPHMDDEVMGCGGAMALHVQAGAEVSVAYLTDGRLGSATVRESDGPLRAAAERELVQVRKREAQEALAILGVRKYFFLDAQDGELEQDDDVPRRLVDLLIEERPQIVYLPFFLEQHPDHRAVSDVLLAAMDLSPDLDFICQGYEVWTPLFPNRFVWIDEVAELKKRALARYRSQLAETRFDHAILGLNAYRSMLNPGGNRGHLAEAYCTLPLHDYRKLYHCYRRAAARL